MSLFSLLGLVHLIPLTDLSQNYILGLLRSSQEAHNGQ